MKKTIGIAGWSGSGKTTLVENLIKVFKNKYKLKVCTLKHAHKNFEIDKKGKDSYRFSKAGSDQVIISSSRQWAVINQLNDDYEVVVVDDGSNDNSLKILREIKNNFYNFRYIPLIRERARKLGETRNISIKAARGEYVILHLDTDDIWEKYIKSLITYLL